jgi:hypothetical protein
LNPDEWKLIREHPQVGAELCAPLVPWLGEWGAGVLDHHERWDGSGYPRGLASADISLAGRVVAVADAFDVMTSARSYKKPRPVDQALDELDRCAGTQFDPNVVRAFLGIPVRKLRRVMGPAAVWAQRPFGGWSWGKIVDTLGGPVVAVCVVALVGLLAPVLGVPAHSQPGRAPVSAPVMSSSRPAAISVPSVANAIGSDANDVSIDLANESPASAPLASSSSPVVKAPTAPGTATDEAGTGAQGDGSSTPPPPPPSSASTPPPTSPATPPLAPPPGAPAITIDPAAGSVSVDGVSSPPVPAPLPASEVPVLQVPAAGAVACDGLGACQPVTIAVPGP